MNITKRKVKKLEEIMSLFEAGEGRKLVKKANEYGIYDVFADLKEYLMDKSVNYVASHLETFADIAIMYTRVSNR